MDAVNKNREKEKKNKTARTIATIHEVVDEIVLLDCSIVHPDPNQPRKSRDTDEFKKVSKSIKTTKGNKTPIKVRKHPSKDNEFMIISGEGRWSACTEHGFKISAIIDSECDESKEQAYEILYEQITENTSRNNLTIIEEADSISRLMALHEPPLTQKQVTEKLGFSASVVSKLVKISKASESIREFENVGRNSLYLLIQIQNITDEKEFSKILKRMHEKPHTEKELEVIYKKLQAEKKPKKGKEAKPKKASKPIQIDTFEFGVHDGEDAILMYLVDSDDEPYPIKGDALEKLKKAIEEL